jgi:hypothetical protein
MTWEFRTVGDTLTSILRTPLSQSSRISTPMHLESSIQQGSWSPILLLESRLTKVTDSLQEAILGQTARTAISTCSSPTSQIPSPTLLHPQTPVPRTMTMAAAITLQPGTTYTCLLSPNASTATSRETSTSQILMLLTSPTCAVLRHRSPVVDLHGATFSLMMNFASMSTHRTCATITVLVSQVG